MNRMNLMLQLLINSLNTDLLVGFFRANKFKDTGMKPYEIIKQLDYRKQKEFIERIEETGLSTKDKRMILTTLNSQTKENIDKSKLPPEYITAIEIQYYERSNQIEIDYNKDLEIYYGLDELIKIYNGEITDLPIEKIARLYEICPQMEIIDTISGYGCTVEEYINGETWIESVLQGINPEWMDIQKVAHIDNAVGKKIIFTPYQGTELDDIRTEQGKIKAENERNMWKIINSEEGVCVGITKLVLYMLKRIGVEAERVDSEKHTFIKLKNIELPISDGRVVKGDTILDSTWNLHYHRFGIEPQNFCRSYEEIRKHDIVKKDRKAIDTKCHENNEALASATLDLDEKSLRDIYTSIGVADKDGNFPIEKNFIKICNMVNAYGYQADKAIEIQLMLLSSYCPEFAICQNETACILKEILSDINFNRCVVNRVYEKDDENKQSVLYVYADLPEVGKKFYFADKETKSFVELPEKEFEQRFECYQRDMEQQNGHRPWEDIEEKPKYLYESSIPATAKNIGGR